MLFGIIILIGLGAIIATSYGIGQTALTNEELTQIKDTCVDCHNVSHNTDDAAVHQAHPDMECSTCHVGTTQTDPGTCADCHSVPDYTNAADVHQDHQNVQCSTCHIGSSDLGQVTESCERCHEEPESPDEEDVHQIHEDLNCSICHVSATQIDTAACANCHSVPVYTSAGDVHQIHANEDCVTCHSDASGLETADKAHDILQWTGIGIVAAAAAGLVLNYAVARVRLAGRKGGDGKTND
ncbi:MAG: hypothetical protein A2Y59_04075 [Chloroflexi bacterium RBG_13_52_14]|nr:MAG: hypothetical protein A2Y59_04075 [Chloroflexi bacterium RBG_13_52_14]